MLGVYSPFSYTKLTILILDECKFLKNGDKFVITVLIISGNEYFDVSENMVYLYKSRLNVFSNLAIFFSLMKWYK